MLTGLTHRQIRNRLPVSSPMRADEIEQVDRAAALRGVSRSEYIRRAAMRAAAADLRRSERAAPADAA